MITRPNGLTLQDWTSRVALDLDSYGSIGRIVGDDWQNWASQLFYFTGLQSNLPRPYEFKTWQEWAERLCQVLA